MWGGISRPLSFMRIPCAALRCAVILCSVRTNYIHDAYRYVGRMPLDGVTPTFCQTHDLHRIYIALTSTKKRPLPFLHFLGMTRVFGFYRPCKSVLFFAHCLQTTYVLHTRLYHVYGVNELLGCLVCVDTLINVAPSMTNDKLYDALRDTCIV